MNPCSFINSINSIAVDVLVSHVVTPSEFYVQYKKDKQLLNALNDQVQKHCTSIKQEAKLEPGITNGWYVVFMSLCFIRCCVWSPS